jgi:iron complex transport system substrate-binding protein
MKRLARALRLGLVAGLAGAWLAATAAVLDDRGKPVALAAPPQRIVSLLPSLTESVCALGACSRLVGTDRYSDHPASVLALPKLGGLEDVQVERIVALRPDVVLAAPSSRVVERLESLGLAVVVLESRNHADVRRSLAVLATMLGEPARGPTLWADIERQLQDAAATLPPALRGQRVYFEVDATPYAAGASSFIGETLQRLGLLNIAPAALGPFPKLNPEFVVRARPEVVMATARNLAEMPRRPGWRSLAALQQHRSCGFDAARYELITRPGPRLGEAALVLAECLSRLREP